MSERIELSTPRGAVAGLLEDGCRVFRGLRYATAGRWEYPKPVESWEGVFDATEPGCGCPQTRTYIDQLASPPRAFYHREFRQGLTLRYDEDCLNLNIWTPEHAERCPVVVFIHGGGFNSGCDDELYIDGRHFCERGIILVTINYRVGILGYMTSAKLEQAAGHDGNYGLADQIIALGWIKSIIGSFGGDAENITVMGQSAGAMSVQFICLTEQARGLFQRVIMISGGGLLPSFASPKPASRTRGYWLDVCGEAGCTLEQLRELPCEELIRAVERVKARRKDSTYNTMPVVDGYYLTDDMHKLARKKKQLPVGYLSGTTSEDLLPYIAWRIANRWSRDNKGYTYYFDLPMPGGDDNGAFHACDQWYFFGTLDRCWRPFGESDRALSGLMMDYLAAYARTGDPNGDGRPVWKSNSRRYRKAMRFGKKIGMYMPGRLDLLHRTLHYKAPQ